MSPKFTFPLMLILLAVNISSVSSQNPKLLKIEILYSSLCPDSVRFMGEQLRQSYADLKDYIDIAFVPFGKSRFLDDERIVCQHGPAECRANRMHSCVLHQSDNQEAQVNFVVCQMLTSDKATIQPCAEATGFASNIDNCMFSLMGTQLQQKAEAITGSYAPAFIPTIVYDGVFNQGLQDSSLVDFRGTVCSLLRQKGAILYQQKIC